MKGNWVIKFTVSEWLVILGLVGWIVYMGIK